MRKGIAYAASVMWAAPCWAQLSVTELDRQPFDTQITELFQLHQGDVLLRMFGWRQANSPSEILPTPWSSLYVLAKDGQVKQRGELPYGLYQSVVPYRDGFAIQRIVTDSCAPRCRFSGEEPTQVVAYEHVTDTQPKVLYQRQPDFHTMLLVGAPDAQDLYVMEAGMEGTQLTRIDSHGQVVWQKASAWIDSSSFVATDDGIAFTQYVSEHDPTTMLRALDRGGRTRWEARLTSRISESPLFSPAGFITLPKRTYQETRLVSLDARTGELTSDVVVEPFSYAVGTKDGLLLAGPMLGQWYVGMLTSDGRFSWLRRYVPDERVSDVRKAVMTREGRLVLITQPRVPTTVTPIISAVITDSTASSLVAARGRCLDPRWTQYVELASQLRTGGLAIEPPKAEELSAGNHSCSDREAQFMTFMQALTQFPLAAPAVDSRQMIAIRLTAADEPLRLEGYGADRSGYPTAGVNLRFAVPYDRGPEFWKIVATRVLPHLERMAALDKRFKQMTGFFYVVSAREGLSYEQTLPELERAAKTVSERIDSIAPERLDEIRKTGPRGYVQILLRPDGFGSGEGEMYPVAVADQTFLAIVERNRRDAEQGNIVIRD